MSDLAPDDLLHVYDDQLREEGELTDPADEVVRHGPVLWAVIGGRRGFVTYRDLGGLGAREIDRLVGETLDHYRADARIEQVEWKTRGHDDAPGLHSALVSRGFERGEVESVMIGEAAALAAPVPTPAGITVRRAESEADVRAACASADEAFGRAVPGMADRLLARMAHPQDGTQVWIAETDAGEVVCSGRLEPVPGTEVAGLWGGATVERWRRRGVYRALSAARARSAVDLGLRWLHSDSSEDSRPILARSGFVKVTTTTPYEWRPQA